MTHTESTSPFDDGSLYDALFHSLDYATDFYVQQASTANGPVLEVACGTGRILLPCLLAGAEVDGLDFSAGMLETCRAKTTNAGFTPALYQADMSDFDLPKHYALITITFNSFVHNLTQEDQLKCLECCRRHLLPNGRLVFDTFFPSLAIIGAPQHTRVLEHETIHPLTQQKLRLYDTRSFDRVKQLQYSINEIECLDSAGNIVAVQRSEFAVRWVYKEEMALLLRLAGFRHWTIDGDFAGTPLTDEQQAMIVTAFT